MRQAFLEKARLALHLKGSTLLILAFVPMMTVDHTSFVTICGAIFADWIHMIRMLNTEKSLSLRYLC